MYVYFMDNKQQNLPHIHVKYQNDEAIEITTINPRVKVVTALPDY